MRRKIGFEVVVLAVVSVVACGQTDRREESRRAMVSQQLAKEQRARGWLEGHTAVIRIYPDVRADPGRYDKSRVRLKDSNGQFALVPSRRPALSEVSYVVALAADQTHRIVAEVLARHVSLRRYDAGPAVSSLIPWDMEEKPGPWWTFLDARGAPMGGASVVWCTKGDDAAPDVYRVPLVPKNSPDSSRAIRGTVRDN